MKIYLIFTLFLAISLLTTENSAGQFMGKIDFEIKDNTENNSNGAFSAYITPTRMMLKSKERAMDFLLPGTQQVSSLLIRLDSNDFIFYDDGSNSAIGMSKVQIEGFFNMMSSMQNMQNSNGQPQPVEPKNNLVIKETGEVSTISGYTARKWLVEDELKSLDGYIILWVTDDIDIYWGMLAEKWNINGELGVFSNSDLFKNGRFPLQLEIYSQDGRLTYFMKAVSVETGEVTSDKISLPTGVQIISLQDMIMQQMMQKRNK